MFSSTRGERRISRRRYGPPSTRAERGVGCVPARGPARGPPEHAGRVRAAPHPPAAPEGGEQLRRLTDTRHDHLEEAADEERRVRIREHRRVLGWEDVVPALGTVE